MGDCTSCSQPRNQRPAQTRAATLVFPDIKKKKCEEICLTMVRYSAFLKMSKKLRFDWSMIQRVSKNVKKTSF